MSYNADDLIQRLKFTRLGAETRRFHTVVTLQQNTVGHHTFNVAWLVHFLTPGLDPAAKLLLMMAALAHDLAEHVVGDMPAPSKRDMGIRDTFGTFENDLMEGVGIRYESLLPDAHKRILKLADSLEGAFFCVSERALGNQQIVWCYDNFRSYIEQLQPTSVVECDIVQFLDDLWEKVNG